MVILAIKFFPFFYGSYCIILTDHSFLKWLKQINDPDDCLSRWALKLQHYNLTTIHCVSAIIENADGFSRLPILVYMAPEEYWVFAQVGRPDLWHLEPGAIQFRLKSMYEGSRIKDVFYTILLALLGFPKLSPLRALMPSWKLTHNWIWGQKKTQDYLCTWCYWEGIIDTKKQVLDSCLVCKSYSGPNLSSSMMSRIPKTTFQIVSIDLIGPLPVAAGGNKCILIEDKHIIKLFNVNSLLLSHY